ncbi:MAG: Mu-like prophage major head subunit gpT family protein, partial [Planctomycetes bacterium]|nr:Mu-like prophage major head subunit gpT family protein [Planctomycetota bacterium]
PEQLAPGGELKHTTFSDEEVTNRLFSYGLMMEIDRTMIINDDMGMLNQIPTMLGQKMATYEEKFFWKYLLSNPGTMFSAAHGNYATGASSALGIDSLTNLRGTFQKQTNSKGDPIAVAPSYLIVPVELEIEARKLLSCDTLIAVGMDNSKKVIPNQNVCTQFGLTLLTSHYLSNAGIAGNSATGWYLAAAPSDVLSFEMLFLNGKANPTVERSDVDFNRLGIAYRVYHDFGLKCIDYRGWAFATGA